MTTLKCPCHLQLYTAVYRTDVCLGNNYSQRALQDQHMCISQNSHQAKRNTTCAKTLNVFEYESYVTSTEEIPLLIFFKKLVTVKQADINTASACTVDTRAHTHTYMVAEKI